MNKSESKYFNTALLMNQALVMLLEKKEFEFITVKEVCLKAGVNRSTFYLHYENMHDLLNETASNIISDFNKKFKVPNTFFNDLRTVDKEELIFINEKYLTPFLEYLKDNRRILILFFKYGDLVNTKSLYNSMTKDVFNTVFSRFNIDRKTQHYMLMFYMNGVFSIVQEWISGDCKDDIKYIIKIIIDCVQPFIK